MWSDGSAIALCPVSRSSTEGSKYQNVIAHEAGGHGFGRLGDEYITNTNKTLPADSKNEVLEWSRYGFYSNIDVTSDPLEIKWKQLFQLTGDSRVGVYQGAYYYLLEHGEPEISSCRFIMNFIIMRQAERLW